MPGAGELPLRYKYFFAFYFQAGGMVEAAEKWGCKAANYLLSLLDWKIQILLLSNWHVARAEGRPE